MKEIVKIEIPNFNEYIRQAEKRKAKPFIKGNKKKIPKKYQNDDYSWNNKGYLIEKATGLVVASNALTVGKPRDWRINGQDIYNQAVKHSARSGIAVKMHNKFIPSLKNIKPLSEDLFPLSLRVNFYILDENKRESKARNIDNDNRWIYEKSIQDTLVLLKIIPDDNPYIINENCKKTIFVENEKDCKLEIILNKDE